MPVGIVGEGEHFLAFRVGLGSEGSAGRVGRRNPRLSVGCSSEWGDRGRLTTSRENAVAAPAGC